MNRTVREERERGGKRERGGERGEERERGKEEDKKGEGRMVKEEVSTKNRA